MSRLEEMTEAEFRASFWYAFVRAALQFSLILGWVAGASAVVVLALVEFGVIR